MWPRSRRRRLRGAREAAAAKDLAVSAACEGCRVRGQRDMLATVLRNLVTNAVKFTRPGGTIHIAAQPEADHVAISVADTGVGMPRQKLATLFKIDLRTTTEGTAGERGSGLGLLLCRELVERQGGELTVTSAVDQGTAFRFVLPAA